MEWESFGCVPQFLRHGAADFIYKPMLEVIVAGPTGGDVILALVDSGTDITMMDAEIAEALGISPDGCPVGTATSIAGSREGFFHEVKIQVPKFDDVLVCNVLFVEGMSGQIILGREDFFTRYFVRFEQNRQKFYLMPSPPPNVRKIEF